VVAVARYCITLDVELAPPLGEALLREVDVLAVDAALTRLAQLDE
jgi:hypothetical protein